jgi:ketosteroid isomerase-like protein
MTSRADIEALLRDLYAARVRGDLEEMFQLFTVKARFEIASVSHGNPSAVSASGAEELHSLLTLLLRTFRVKGHTILSLIIDGENAAVRWHASVYSRITGVTVPTEFIDIVEADDGRIASFIEFFVPR